MKHDVMKPARLERYKDELLELRARLVGDVNRLIEAIPNEMQAAGDLSHVLYLQRPIAIATAWIRKWPWCKTRGTCWPRSKKRWNGSRMAHLRRAKISPADRRRAIGLALPYAPLCITCAQAAQSEA